MAVAATGFPTAHVEPLSALPVVLKEQLVEVGMRQQEDVVGTARLRVAQPDVCGLSAQMAAVTHAAHRLVELWATVSAVDVDGAELPAQGFENLIAEVLEVLNGLLRRLVTDAQAPGRGRLCKLAQPEMWGELSVFYFNLLFHVSW